ncbi:hypothetical protein QAD02_012773 [Eretmocerus hayati]|uniref:Uncharacterized protein n=1 Tax=Eretmocerus hayati TaxID=131215 RepID=A0ACC2P0N9_9HYME|nr:hypothetical protein QAD02_012773 [Eretmocerus hayati]
MIVTILKHHFTETWALFMFIHQFISSETVPFLIFNRRNCLRPACLFSHTIVSDCVSPGRAEALVKYYFEKLRKKYEESDLQDIVRAIVEEIHGAGYNLGYRSLHEKLKTVYHLNVKRDTVYLILSIADPEGISDRRARRLRRRQFNSRGPNFVWSFDGYDKIKVFGFPIHGCIDGYSRKILWLVAATTNNDPRVTAHRYLKTVKKLRCVPTMGRSDCGGENTLIGSLQICLRSKHDDRLAGPKSYYAGTSTKNQRIESFWGHLRKHSMDYWIQFFKCMEERGLFDGSEMHKKCMQFCFGHLIQKDLDESRLLWNKHLIRKQSSRGVIHGRPFTLYHLPEKYGSKDYRKPVGPDVVDRLLRKYTKEPQLYDPLIAEVAHTLIPDLTIPVDTEDPCSCTKSSCI